MSSMMMKLREQARKKAEEDDAKRGVKRLPPMDLRPDDSMEIGYPDIQSVTDADGFQRKAASYKKLRDSLSIDPNSDAAMLDPAVVEAKRKKRKLAERAEED